MRIAFFGTTSRFSLLAFEQLALSQEMVALVLPGPAKQRLHNVLRRFVGLRSASPLEQFAHRRGIPVVTASGDLSEAVGERLRTFRPELICIATFPRILPRDLMAIAPLGAINAHPSLLPRHRGPLPLFWTYHCDDRFAGVTVHHASERFDAGDIILQARFDLPRAYPVAALDKDVADQAAPLLREAVAQLGRGCALRIPQDESAATYAPIPRPGTAMVPFERWDVERVWHFLAALCPRYREPLVDERGREVLYERVIEYRRGPTQGAPGSVEYFPGGWTLHCQNGVLRLGV